jgi:hypothetical protein
MDKGTMEAIVELYDRTIAEAQSELASLESSSQELARRSSAGGAWGDLKPRDIAHFQEIIARYEALKRELTDE